MSIEVRERRNRFRRRPVLSMLATIAGILFLVEIGLRVWSPGALVFAHSFRGVLRYHDRWYTDFMPDTSTTVRWRNGRGIHILNFLVTVGHLGFRTADRELDNRPTPGRGSKFIHAIGDSFTMGWGVNYDSSYPALLDFMLPSDWRVLNLGLAGFGAVAATEKSLSVTDSFPPSAVVYLFHPGDYDDDEHAMRWARLPRVVHRGADLLNGLRRHTYLASIPFALRWWLRFDTYADASEADFRTTKLSPSGGLKFDSVGDDDSPSDPARGAASKQALLRFAGLLDERGAPLIVLCLHTNSAARDFAAFSRENGIELHLLHTPEGFRLVGDRHLNALGNYELALYVAGLLRQKGIGASDER
jgi:hypothetical protein